MSYQYDVEEQAGDTGSLFGGEEELIRVFMPVAPVQLAKEWSPVPGALAVMGDATVHNFSKQESLNSIALAWFGASVSKSKNASPAKNASLDERRFFSLLAVCGERALRQHAGILLVAQAGWSYDGGMVEFDARTNRIMRKAGFAVLDRHAATPRPNSG